MSLPSVNPIKTNAWKKLQQHFQETKNVKMQDLFAEDETRADRFAISWNDFYVDFSKNRITSETFSLLLQLAEDVNLKEAIQQQFSGANINETENRAVLHTALRDFKNMKPEVANALQQMKQFSEAVIQGDWKGYTGKPITTIVNIGIGGSDLGPDMVTEALTYYKNQLQTYFISNVDGDHVMETLKKLNPETTLFIIVSKTFTTQETLTNATTVRSWFLKTASESDVAKHFVAVSTNLEAVKEFGIASENIFPMWDWVGGRFSLWSAVGLSICCSVGYTNFEDLLKGANEMDGHFSETPFQENIPVVLALLSVWYANFYKAESEAVLPYTQYLTKLVPYLQQAIMESNGKSIDRNDAPVDYETGTIIWGGTGTNSQHAFFQLLHQGTKLIPSDFIGFAESLHGNKEHHDKLLANFIAQTEALLQGTEGVTTPNNYKKFEGNKPTNTILIQKLTPKSIGSLIALYEHKLFVQGIVWNIYSYDQWGVELGKNIAKHTLKAIQSSERMKNSSTNNLLSKI
ncbi:glucose-6-phosphate isomerase [Ulvibacter litoralis]|uniref:Glucose-6-phosphate isomerase n=1 Tax=Ulvibacter litoralis TaxID=227084 RepID=A0A1G7HDD9_9FLAO|nr:glucose-6-phosphate isomerase [Ulvibacter litoralis]GHC57405.1 glucose-6-phosphate isomerase [Ulvibacter litoralis]SDE98470.1 glucose-6-phosphate isomerase [Ulvibacter litoralis]